jgi:membrane associated rhomboid family serine protease
MLPIRDRNRSGIIPWATYGLIAANVAVFLYEFSLPQEDLQALVGRPETA